MNSRGINSIVDIDFLGQLIDSMEQGVIKLEEAVRKNKIDDANRLKTFVFDLHRQISAALGGSNV